MYRKREIYCGKILEVEKYCSFNYKGKRTVRGPRMEKTSEAVAKVNERTGYQHQLYQKRLPPSPDLQI